MKNLYIKIVGIGMLLGMTGPLNAAYGLKASEKESRLASFKEDREIHLARIKKYNNWVSNPELMIKEYPKDPSFLSDFVTNPDPYAMIEELKREIRLENSMLAFTDRMIDRIINPLSYKIRDISPQWAKDHPKLAAALALALAYGAIRVGIREYKGWMQGSTDEIDRAGQAREPRKLDVFSMVTIPMVKVVTTAFDIATIPIADAWAGISYLGSKAAQLGNRILSSPALPVQPSAE